MKLDKELRFMDKLLIMLRDAYQDPSLPDELRAQRKEEMELAMSIHKHLKALSKPDKYRLYKQFIGVHHNWHKQAAGIAPRRIGAAGGAAMNQIIAYLIEQSKGHTEESALEAWKFIFKYWGKLSPFLQQQKSLQQINKNLTEILDNIRNGHHKANTGTNRLSDLERELREER